MNHPRRHLELRMEQYSQILFTYYRDAERAEARNDRYGSFIDLVAGSGLLHGQVILGQDVFCLSRRQCEGSDPAVSQQHYNCHKAGIIQRYNNVLWLAANPWRTSFTCKYALPQPCVAADRYCCNGYCLKSMAWFSNSWT